MNPADNPFWLWKHLNKLRWLSLSSVFLMLILIPFLHVYQTFLAAHAYDFLEPGEQQIYDTMEWLTTPFLDDPVEQLDLLKGTTWSGRFGTLKLSDPLAVVGQVAGSRSIYWPFALTALIPVIITALFGRLFCGWICPASFLFELNTNLGVLLRKSGLRIGSRRYDRRLKYLVLLVGAGVAVATGSVVFAAIYPPAVVGREIYYAIALGGFGSGMVYFLLILLFDLLVARRGFCRYLCAGGALYSLIGRFRLLRIKRVVENCNDCGKCSAVCEFGLDPHRDNFGQECNNCTSCIAACPTDAMTFIIRPRDVAVQGPGHLGRKYRGQQGRSQQSIEPAAVRRSDASS